MFDETERDRILELIDNELFLPRVARVTKVYEHTESDDVSNHEVDVELPVGNPTQKHVRIPVSQPSDGTVFVPETKDIVLIVYLDGDGEDPVVVNSVYANADEDRAPLGEAGDRRIRAFDKLELEITTNDNEEPIIRLLERQSDSDTPRFGVQINGSTSAFKLVDSQGMGISSDGSGNLKICGNSIDTFTDGTTIQFP